MHHGLWRHWESFTTPNQKTLRRDEVHNTDQSIVLKTIKSEMVGKKNERSKLPDAKSQEMGTGKLENHKALLSTEGEMICWTGKP